MALMTHPIMVVSMVREVMVGAQAQETVMTGCKLIWGEYVSCVVLLLKETEILVAVMNG